MGKFYLLVLAFCCGVFPLRAQSIHFDRLDINDGLSQNTVTSIIQDDKGFMWFGTKDGLCRYDGKSFKTFMHDPRLTAGLGNSLIKRLVQVTDTESGSAPIRGFISTIPKRSISPRAALRCRREAGHQARFDSRLRPGGPRLDRRGERRRFLLRSADP